MNFPPPPDVAGLSLDGTQAYVIDPDENRALCETVGVTSDADGRAHPIYYFIATQAGMGLTVAGLCAACEFDVEDGPMLASTRVDYARELLTGEPYRVTGEIVSLTRKPSRKLGAMDLLEYRLRLIDAGGNVVLMTTNNWVLPRKDLV